MWLLPLLPAVASAAGRVFYRLTVAGEPVPRQGPLLLVANHPNSLFDALLVITAARRRVRLLAKAPLFTDPLLGWLMRAIGGIPVYRRMDAPELIAKNVEMFAAAHEALIGGSAATIFPEGRSHGEPSIGVLKTGAARIALGAAHELGSAFPIVPIGLVFRGKEIFRSEAIVIGGEPIDWNDLAGRTEDDVEATRELTDRIERGLRRVTVNLDAWTDAPLVDSALDIWESEYGADPDPAARVRRMETTTTLLHRVRGEPDPAARGLIDDVRAFDTRLRRLRLRPLDLDRDVTTTAALWWSVKRLPLLGLSAMILAWGSHLLFYPPYWLTGRIAGSLQSDPEGRSTHKLLVGIVLYTLWVLALAGAAWTFMGWLAAALVLVAAPWAGVIGLSMRERWRGSLADARSWFLLRSRRRLVAELVNRRRELARRIDGLHRQQLTPP